MPDYVAPLRDINFVLDHVVDLDEICQLEKFESLDPDTIKGVLEENGRFVSDVIAPLNQIGDQVGSVHDPASGAVTTPPGFKEAYAQYIAGGWGAVPFDPAYGGGGFPWLIGTVLQELVGSANLAFSMCPLLTQGAIDMLTQHASEEVKEVYLRKMVTGEWTGTMNLTEPEAGSDVGALRTKAEPSGDGTWRITGTKIFITFGEHDLADNIVHLVLARTPGAPPGTKGISCFVVPKVIVNDDGSLGERNDVRCVSIEHKVGIKASPTCVMSYGEDGGAIGHLVGEEHQGMRHMFTMMNNARLSVGLEGLALAERSYQQAVGYAQERRQGRALGAPPGEQSLIIEHADVRRMLMTMKAYIEAMRALCYFNAEATDMAHYHPDSGISEPRQGLVDLLTPITKAWCTDVAVEVTSLAIQVHGGMGYIEETGVAQHWRDARITPIYEGTNGIQAMDLVARKLPMSNGEVVRDFLAIMAALDPALVRAGDELLTIRQGMADALNTLIEATAWFFEKGLANPVDALAGATPYLKMFGLVAGGWLLAKSALVANQLLAKGEGDPDFLKAKMVTARFYAENILPATKGLLLPITSGSGNLFAVEPKNLGG